MLDWIIISSLILGGIALIIIEIIFVPGTTVVGVMGFLLGGYGIYHSYELFGTTTGHIVFGVSAVLVILSSIYSLKSNAWKKLALKGSIDSRVNEHMTSHLSVGQEGVSVSSLKPVGKAAFDDVEFEVKSLGNFVLEETAIKIIRIERNNIFVEPINQQ
ncbi:MAG: NfeD family protein [Reichenbachiella sp.]